MWSSHYSRAELPERKQQLGGSSGSRDAQTEPIESLMGAAP